MWSRSVGQCETQCGASTTRVAQCPLREQQPPAKTASKFRSLSARILGTLLTKSSRRRGAARTASTRKDAKLPMLAKTCAGWISSGGSALRAASSPYKSAMSCVCFAWPWIATPGGRARVRGDDEKMHRPRHNQVEMLDDEQLAKVSPLPEVRRGRAPSRLLDPGTLVIKAAARVRKRKPCVPSRACSKRRGPPTPRAVSPGPCPVFACAAGRRGSVVPYSHRGGPRWQRCGERLGPRKKRKPDHRRP